MRRVGALCGALVMLASMTAASRVAHAQPASSEAKRHYQTTPRWPVFYAGGGVGVSGILTGIVLLTVAEDHAASRDDLLAGLEGSLRAKCGPGTPYPEECAEALADAEVAAATKPLGGGLLAGGLALTVVAMTVTFLVPERALAARSKRADNAAQPTLSLKPSFMLSPDFSGVGLVGQF